MNRARFGSPVSDVVERLVAQLVLERARPVTSRIVSTTPRDVGVVDEVRADDLGVDQRVVRPHQPYVEVRTVSRAAVQQLTEEARRRGRAWSDATSGSIDAPSRSTARKPRTRTTDGVWYRMRPSRVEDHDGVVAVADELLEPSLAPLLVELLGCTDARRVASAACDAEDRQALVELVGHPLDARDRQAGRQADPAHDRCQDDLGARSVDQSDRAVTDAGHLLEGLVDAAVGPFDRTVRADDVGGVDRPTIVHTDPRHLVNRIVEWDDRPTRMPAGDWTWLELTKILVGALTPLLLVILGFVINRAARRVEDLQWTSRKVVEKRLQLYEEMAPRLNDILVFFLLVGHFREVTPPDVIKKKRNSDPHLSR